ncbi:hypothetical protein PT2222_20336 [Paraburkholderia tropica]
MATRDLEPTRAELTAWCSPASRVSNSDLARGGFDSSRGSVGKALATIANPASVLSRTLKTEGRTDIRDVVSISERLATAECRAMPVHWKSDLLDGNATSRIATRVGGQSRFAMRVTSP